MTPPPSLRGRPVVVTGGCGFLGSHLVRRLIAERAGPVTVLDALVHGEGRLSEVAERVRIRRFRLGADDPAGLEPLLEGVDTLFHLAAEKHSGTRTDARTVLQSNVMGGWGLLDAAARAGVRRVVFSSSLYAYGRRSRPEMDESEPALPDTVYGISKVACERMLAHLHATTGLEYAALRYFFTYGPEQYPGTGFSSLVVRILDRLRAGETVTVYGDGEQTYDYVYVEDVVEATLLAATHPAATAGLFNVGSGQPTRVIDFIDRMIAASGRPATKQHLPPDHTAGTFMVARTDRIRERLGWAPRVSLDEGLARTWKWLEAQA